MFSAIAWIAKTQTELPNSLYAWVSDTGIMKFSGKPWSLAKKIYSVSLKYLFLQVGIGFVLCQVSKFQLHKVGVIFRFYF